MKVNLKSIGITNNMLMDATNFQWLFYHLPMLVKNADQFKLENGVLSGGKLLNGLGFETEEADLNAMINGATFDVGYICLKIENGTNNTNKGMIEAGLEAEFLEERPEDSMDYLQKYINDGVSPQSVVINNVNYAVLYKYDRTAILDADKIIEDYRNNIITELKFTNIDDLTATITVNGFTSAPFNKSVFTNTYDQSQLYTKEESDAKFVKYGSLIVPTNNTTTPIEARIPLVEGKMLEFDVLTIASGNNPANVNVNFFLQLGFDGSDVLTVFRVKRKFDVKTPTSDSNISYVSGVRENVPFNVRGTLNRYSGKVNFLDNFVWGAGEWSESPSGLEDYWTNNAAFNFTKDLTNSNINEIVFNIKETSAPTKIIYRYL